MSSLVSLCEMRLEIHQTDGTLPFIGVIPSYGIGQLEGYNGVGKSLTISVLEICAGIKPAMTEEAWRGLCDGMGKLEVTATELRETEQLKWVLDGQLLFEESQKSDEERPELDWFVNVTIDGNQANSLDEVRRLFSVERINGDIGLIEQLAISADLAMRDLNVAGKGVIGSAKMEEVEDRISAVVGLLDELPLDRVTERAKAAAELKAEREKAEAEIQAADQQVNLLDEAVTRQARLEEISVRGGALDAQIEKLDSEIDALKEQRNKVGRDLGEAEAAASASSDVREELTSATRSYKSASTKLRNATKALAKATQIAELADDDDPGRRGSELEEELQVLIDRRLEADAGPAVLDLIDDVSPSISQAAATANLAGQPLLSSPGLTPGTWTVEQVADALGRRHDEIEELPAPREAERIDAQIDTKKAQLSALREIKSLREKRQRAAELLNDAQDKSDNLSEKLDKAAAPVLSELRDKRRELDNQLSDLGGKRAVLSYRRDALGAPEEKDAFEAQLSELLKKLGIDGPEVAAAYAGAAEALDRQRDALMQLKDRERSIASEFERDLREVDRTVQALSSDEAHRWLPTDQVTLPSKADGLADQLAAIQALREVIRRVDARLTGFRQAFFGLRASLEAVADDLRGRSPEAAVRVDEVRAWLEEEAAQWFSDEDFRNALLGEGATDIRVDLRSLQVSWQSDGAQHTKPIEALSSGERAFALTQARLAVLEKGAGAIANRLIALDEFGAFVSSDRIYQLSEYLQHWRQKHANDQILIILPATQDYEALARATDGGKSERYARMAESLRSKEWLIEEFEAA